ncbi:MAG: flagellar basal body rod protein FlgC [Candidatus Marinimicrobia bacterium]|nr:flagellar basal body rod protein FlgC [Candidatus Neomarinimicrobiota bacterium]
MKVSGIFTAIRTNLSGLSTQMKRLEAISENVANAETAPDVNGNVYKRKIVDQRPLAKVSGGFGNEMALSMKRSSNGHFRGVGNQKDVINTNSDNIKIVELNKEKLIFDPAHPRADENGYVRMPDINVVEEMVDLISASRAYEANVTVLDAAKSMAKNTLKI